MSLLFSLQRLHSIGSYSKLLAAAFWKQSNSSMSNACGNKSIGKPPNILIYTGNDLPTFHKYQSILQRILEPDCYAIYHYEGKGHWKCWLQNICLLVIASPPNGNQAAEFHCFVENGGKCLTFGVTSGNSTHLTPVHLFEEHHLVAYQSSAEGILVELLPTFDLQRLPNVLSQYLHVKCNDVPTDQLKPTAAFLIAKNRDEHHGLKNAGPFVFTQVDDVPPVTDNCLPVLVGKDSDSFNSQQFYLDLKTRVLGRTLIYSQVMTSTQSLLESSHDLPDGLAVVARYQTQGRGRRGNIWISPRGCATFSLRLQVPQTSKLAGHLSFVQHTVALAVVLAIKNLPNCHRVKLAVKWPNDIYYEKSAKVGGVLVNTSIAGRQVTLNIGCGLNLDNLKPTVSVNDVIEKHGGSRLTLETYLAAVFNQLEQLFDMIYGGQFQKVVHLYLQHWLHQGDNVVIEENGTKWPAKIVAVDNFGFLQVEKEDGSMRTVHPDGNSFDMLNGLIVPKSIC